MKDGQINLAYIGTTYQTPKGGTLTVIRATSRRRGKNIIWGVECSICSKDHELFPDLFDGNKYQMDVGQCPCACTPYQYSEKQNKIRLSRIGLDLIKVEDKKYFVEDSDKGVCYWGAIPILLKNNYNPEPMVPARLKHKPPKIESQESSRNRLRRCKSEFTDLVKASGFTCKMSDFKNSSSFVRITCNNGHNFKAQPKQFKFRGGSCPACNGNVLRHREKVDEICSTLGYKILHRSTSTEPSLLECGDGHKFSINTGNLTINHKCPECDKNRMRGDFLDVVASSNFTMLGQYVDNDSPIKMKCGDGHVINQIPMRVRSVGLTCAPCAGKCSENARLKFFKKLSDYNYTIVGDYTNVTTSTRIKCHRGHVRSVAPSTFSKRCPQCDIEDLYNEVVSVGSDNGLIIGGAPISMGGKITVNCSVGHSFNSTMSGVIRAPRCRVCNRLEYRLRERCNTIGFSVVREFKSTRSDGQQPTKKAVIKCSKGHKTIIGVSEFLKSSSCVKCSGYGFDKTSEGWLYILRSIESNEYKVGISNNPKTRIQTLRRNTPFDFDVVGLFRHRIGRKVMLVEKKMHSMFESADRRGFDGATEWLIADGSITDIPLKLGLTT